MEGEICQHHKYGYCRFKTECKKKHLSSECADLEECKNSKGCQKRHPKLCKRYASGNCRFENGCAYKHKKSSTTEENEQLKDKLQVFEKVLHAMTRKVLSLETEVEKLIKKSSNNVMIDNPTYKVDKVVDVQDTQKEMVDESNSFSHEEIKEKCSTPKENKEKVDKVKTKSDLLNCDECNYTCKKEKSLKNHKLTKHEHHKCKECNENLPNFMQLLKHVAKYHNTEDDEKSKEEVVKNNEVSKVHHQIDHSEEDNKFLPKESMVDNVLKI